MILKINKISTEKICSLQRSNDSALNLHIMEFFFFFFENDFTHFNGCRHHLIVATLTWKWSRIEGILSRCATVFLHNWAVGCFHFFENSNFAQSSRKFGKSRNFLSIWIKFCPELNFNYQNFIYSRFFEFSKFFITFLELISWENCGLKSTAHPKKSQKIAWTKLLVSTISSLTSHETT